LHFLAQKVVNLSVILIDLDLSEDPMNEGWVPLLVSEEGSAWTDFGRCVPPSVIP